MRRLLAAAVPSGLRGRLRRLQPEHALAAGAFDRGFYLRTYPDVAQSGMDPLEHFMAHGWREGRDPSPDFSVRAYLEAVTEVAESGENPFLHWLAAGRPQVVRREHPLGFRYEIVARLVPLEARIAKAVGQAPPRLDDEAVLAQALTVSREGFARVHVTFSHDDFTANLGGVQLVIGREASALEAAGRDHLHLYPARPWPVVRPHDAPGALGVVWNGKPVGVFAPAAIARVLGAAAGSEAGEGRSFAIHSLLGHTADETADILAAAGLGEGAFWLHDFASLCAGFHLLRDDVEDCAAPPPGSPACGVCVYGAWRERHRAEHARLFQRLRLTVVSPSQNALDLWRSAGELPAAGLRVHPHVTLAPRGPAPEAEPGRPFRLAYAGFPAAHKGWPLFRRLALRYAADPRYAFVHLGARAEPNLGLPFHPVRVSPDQPLAMQAALEEHRPDAVLVWSLCRETFSFVAHEAVAAGCAVITGPDSGNVAAFVAASGQGTVLDDEAALEVAFESGSILALARAARRPQLHDIAFSDLLVDLRSRA